VIVNLLRRLWPKIDRERKKWFGFVLFLMIITSFTEIVSIGSVIPFLGVLTMPENVFGHEYAQPWIEFAGITAPEQLLLPVTLLFIAAILMSSFSRILLLWAQTRLAFTVGADISIDIYRRTLYQPYAVHVSRNSSELISGIYGKANQVIGQAVLPMLLIMSSTIGMVSIVITLSLINVSVALISIVGIGAFYMLIVLVTKNKLASNGELISEKQDQVVKALQEGLSGIRDVLIDGTQENYCRIFMDADIPRRRATEINRIITAIPRIVIEAVGVSLIAVIAYFFAMEEDGVSNIIPVLGAMALGAQRLMPISQQIYSSWSLMRGGHAALSDVLALLEQPMPKYVEEENTNPIEFKYDLNIDSVSFQYVDGGSMILEDIRFCIPKGSSIGFIGETGSGKSTLIDIIMCLLEPTKGDLRVDGEPITEKNRRSWQMHIAHVPQEIYLADSSIAENIAFGVPREKIDLELVRTVARQAHIAETIETWSEQYNTFVGERGHRLSGGQRQRIGIARALYKDANVIVLDEATSALDTDTEKAVMEEISGIEGGITTILIAHRMTTLRQCDQIVQLDRGRVVRIGSYKDIVE